MRDTYRDTVRFVFVGGIVLISILDFNLWRVEAEWWRIAVVTLMIAVVLPCVVWVFRRINL